MSMISTELDWLEIRLHELYHEVDYFIIVEAVTTFTKTPKPLHVKNAWSKFRRYHSKMIHHVVDFSPLTMQKNDTWEQENFMRQAMYDQALLSQIGNKAPQLGDVLIVSDVDEVPRRSTIPVLRNCAFPARTTLRSDFYYYSFQWKHRGKLWEHPQATFFKGMNDTIGPHELRGGIWSKPYFEFYNAAWSCSSCFATLKDLRTKITSFSHVEYNLEKFRETGWLVDCVRFGRDLFNRTREVYDRVEGNRDLPEVLLTEEGRGKFGYMLDRDGVDGGLRDVEP
ncbi:uncharacterized protein KY384_005159 [Bacidia gigantensis]|uniref:uncharacterized protein n=1 Tax=Bacidia gigantensis TaxID=2732470 RepID=UPI001D0468B5|nr:uncharacterized protein KY384_005159 [Bacidia gigantensis]KAG8529678.1 hypothetical protein KY384_005159 [Bacidia gigantensis]